MLSTFVEAQPLAVFRANFFKIMVHPFHRILQKGPAEDICFILKKIFLLEIVKTIYKK